MRFVDALETDGKDWLLEDTAPASNKQEPTRFPNAEALTKTNPALADENN